MSIGNIQENLITVKRYKINGKYIEERASLHQHIIYVKVKDKRELHPREAILIGGGSGAGKSTIIEEYLMKPKGSESLFLQDYVYIDSDEVKLHLDEYKQYQQSIDTIFYAAFYVHEESGDIVTALIDECIRRNLSFIYDGTMSWQPLYDELIPRLRLNGYQIRGVFVDVDEQVAIDRVKKRGLETGRFVNPEFVRKANRNAAITFKNLESLFDSVLMFNNSEEHITRDKDICLIYERELTATGTFSGEILNKEQFELFMEKANLPKLP